MSTVIESVAPVHATREFSPRVGGPAIIYAIRWLISDTFRQAIASRIFWFMLGVSTLCILFCLGISVESGLAPRSPTDTSLYTKSGVEFVGPGSTQAGKLSLLFGFIQIDHTRHALEAVRFVQVVLASFVAGVIGFLLTIVWTAGFLPDFLQPSAASVLFAKPIPRWTLIVGKYIGVVAFVTFQISYFFIGTWIALGLRTNIWEYNYLAIIPLFVLHFAIIYSFAVLIAVCTRSAIASLFGTVLFWLLCWGMNLGHHFVVGFDQLAGRSASLGAFSRTLVEIGYWILPKPADILILKEQALHAQNYTTTLSSQPTFRALLDQGMFYPEWSIIASLLFALGLLWVSARQLTTMDY